MKLPPIATPTSLHPDLQPLDDHKADHHSPHHHDEHTAGKTQLITPEDLAANHPTLHHLYEVAHTIATHLSLKHPDVHAVLQLSNTSN